MSTCAIEAQADIDRYIGEAAGYSPVNNPERQPAL
jgi:hypothetical protein